MKIEPSYDPTEELDTKIDVEMILAKLPKPTQVIYFLLMRFDTETVWQALKAEGWPRALFERHIFRLDRALAPTYSLEAQAISHERVQRRGF